MLHIKSLKCIFNFVTGPWICLCLHEVESSDYVCVCVKGTAREKVCIVCVACPPYISNPCNRVKIMKIPPARPACSTWPYGW